MERGGRLIRADQSDDCACLLDRRTELQGEAKRLAQVSDARENAERRMAEVDAERTGVDEAELGLRIAPLTSRAPATRFLSARALGRPPRRADSLEPVSFLRPA